MNWVSIFLFAKSDNSTLKATMWPTQKYLLSDHPHCLYLMKFCHSLIYQVFMCMLSHFNRVQLFVTLWTVTYQASLSMGFSRQEYWSGLPCPPPGDLSNSGIEHSIAGRFFPIWATSDTQEYWSGKPIPSQGDLPDLGIELGSPALQVGSLPAESWGKPSMMHANH